MANFQMSVSKGSQGEILAYGNYVSGTEPIFVERVIIQELDAQGNTVGGFVYRLNQSLDPTPGSVLLASKIPSGSNVKAAQASACYVEVKGLARSPKFTL
jgi:hypothetical protein